jgi:hypothetical protein
MRLIPIVIPALVASACVVVQQQAPVDPYPHGSGNGLPSSASVYVVAPDVGTVIPGGAIGYSITTNSGGGFKVAWTDTNGSAAHFHGSLFTNGTFGSNVVGTGTAYATLVGSNRIDFDSTPGAGLDSVECAPTVEPLIVDLLVDNGYSGFEIFFTDATTGLVSSTGGVNPAAFQIP